MNENGGWICLFRKFINWEWYQDINVKVVFLHLLLTANHKDSKWQGIEIKRGQKITSISHLASEVNLSVRQVRTALNKLEMTNEITIETTNKYTLISIVKYNFYQDKDNENDKQNNTQDDKRATNERQTNDKRATTNNNDNNITINNNDNNNNIPASEDKSSTASAKASKHKYGEYNNVLLKDEELQKLKKDYSNWEELIKYLDEYIEMKGYKAKSHYLCIKKWVVDAVNRTSKNTSKTAEEEFLND